MLYRSWDFRLRRPGPTHVRTQRWDGKHMAWYSDGKPGLGGHEMRDLAYVPIRPLPPDVVVCEGEKATDAVIDAGYCAIGTVCGASSTPGEEFIRALVDHRVILWPDHDAVGYEHMGRIGTTLWDLGAKVGVVRVSKDAAPHTDAADFNPKRIALMIADALWRADYR